MKKLLISIIICLATAVVFADNENLVFFQGIGCSFADASDALDLPLMDQVNYAETALSERTDDIVIVAHSQGALRAHGLAGKLNQDDDPSVNIDTLISIGGPVIGFSPLNQGFNVLRQEVNDDIALLTRAFDAAAEKTPMKVDITHLLLTAGTSEGNLIDLIIGDDVDENSLSNTSIAGMMPSSDFITENIRFYESTWKTYNTIFGVIRVLSSFKLQYSLPENTTYGYIIGNDSNILNLVEQKVQASKDDDDNSAFYTLELSLVPDVELNARQTIELARDGMDFAKDRWDIETSIYKTALNAPFAGPFVWLSGQYDRTYELYCEAYDKASYCRDGEDYLENIEAKYSSLLGTQPGGNDCLIPVSDQYINVTNFGGQTIDSLEGRFVPIDSVNHIEETSDAQIWGTGTASQPVGLDNGRVGRGGILWKWLDYADVRQREGDIIK